MALPGASPAALRSRSGARGTGAARRSLSGPVAREVPAFPAEPAQLPAVPAPAPWGRRRLAASATILIDNEGNAQRPGPLGHMEDAALRGLVLETLAEREAGLQRHEDVSDGHTVTAFVGGGERDVTADEEPRLSAAYDHIRWRWDRVARALCGRNVGIRGGRWSCALPDGNTISVDVPMRVGVLRSHGQVPSRRKALVEMKYSPKSVRTATRRVAEKLDDLRAAAEGGTWRSGRRSGSSAAAPLIGGLAIADTAWRLLLWRVPSDPEAPLRPLRPLEGRVQKSGADRRRQPRKLRAGPGEIAAAARSAVQAALGVPMPAPHQSDSSDESDYTDLSTGPGSGASSEA